jgi:DNA-binding NarL/FixJ family response regulator
VPVELDVHTSRRLPDRVELAAYYVVAKALTNTAKHARASVVRVELNAEDACIELAVRDDGVEASIRTGGQGSSGSETAWRLSEERSSSRAAVGARNVNPRQDAARRGRMSATTAPKHEPTTEHALRIALADDDVLLREGLASLLERHGFDVVGQAGDGPELLEVVRAHEPELVIVDIRMPPEHSTEGLDAAGVIRQEFPATGVLVLSAHVEVDQALELLAGGKQVGYLLKTRVTDVAEFVDAVERIARGGSVVDPSLVQELVTARRRNDPLESLTPREREVLALMAEGLSNAGIGRRLSVTDGTVEKHVNGILMKLQLPESQDDHRRVLAVIAFLEAR